MIHILVLIASLHTCTLSLTFIHPLLCLYVFIVLTVIKFNSIQLSITLTSRKSIAMLLSPHHLTLSPFPPHPFTFIPYHYPPFTPPYLPAHLFICRLEYYFVSDCRDILSLSSRLFKSHALNAIVTLGRLQSHSHLSIKY